MQAAHMKVYVDDHLSGAATVIELVRRRLERDTAEPWLHTFLVELEEERDMLTSFVADVGGHASPTTQAAGWVAEKAAQVKLLADARLGEALRDLLELEAMRTGVEGKRCLIRSLRTLAHEPRVARLDLDAWEDMAATQAHHLEELRTQAAVAALSGAETA